MENESIKKPFAMRLKEIRKSKGLTQEELCDITGIDVSNYSKMETGKILPSLNSLDKLIKKAGFKPNDLFNFEHLKNESDLDKEIINMYNEFSIYQKRFLYKIMSGLKELP